jgi:hypothetical protein
LFSVVTLVGPPMPRVLPPAFTGGLGKAVSTMPANDMSRIGKRACAHGALVRFMGE